MKVDAVIFDKDGTLIDFDAFWVTVSIKAFEEILAHFDKQDIPMDDMLEAFGVHDGITDIDGVLCKGTYEQMGQLVYEILHRHGCTASCNEVIDVVIDAYNRNSDAGEVKATCPNIIEVLTRLKNQNKKLAVVTTDNEKITHECLKKLGIEDMFEKIYTDDGHTPRKPDPYCAMDFCRSIGIEKERIVMIGDTMTDIRFAKNAGIPVIVLAKTDKNRKALSPFADVVVSNLAAILDILE